MDILLLLVPLALILGVVFVAALAWAVRSGQFEDLDDPAHSVLDDHRGP